MRKVWSPRRYALIGSLALFVATASPAWALQEAANDPAKDDAQSGDELGDIIVTATKQTNVRAQTVPIAITAIGQEQLAELHVQNLSSLNHVAPNVQFETGSGPRGGMNFSIRGLGTNSSSAAVEPQVGLFVDGVYVGAMLGSLVDTFDMEAVEVLRGPQGVLFGKNVTGGAVVVRTTTPGDTFHVDANASIESGPQYTMSSVLSGPISDKLSAKIAGFFSKDEGYFRDIGPATRGSAGGSRTWLARGALRFRPTDEVDLVARVEHGNLDADEENGFQNIDLYNQGVLDKFEVSTSGLSLTRVRWTNATLESNFDVGLGGGTITNIAGWRGVNYVSRADVDALPAYLFQSVVILRQRQISDELRYAGTFGNLNLSTGLFYFSQKYNVGDGRIVNGTEFSGGGIVKQRVLGAFLSGDWRLSEQLTVNLGGRLTSERKRARSGALGVGRCDYSTIFSDDYQCNFDFTGAKTWNAFIPKIGVQWKPAPSMQIYSSWTIGIRSGGFSTRRSVAGAGGGPYEQEKNYALEAGFKSDLADNHVRLNTAIYRMVVKNLQRDVQVPSGTFGLVTQTANVADAIFQGAEAETIIRVGDGLTLNGYVGIIDGHFTRVSGDLSGDGVVNAIDRQLNIVRVPPFSWGAGFNYEHRLGKLGNGSIRLNYGYKDRQEYSDNNLNTLTKQQMLDGSIDLVTMNDAMTISIFGRNLLDKQMTNVRALLPAALGGGYQALDKGRVIGASIRYRL